MRFNCQVLRAEDGEEVSYPWQTEAEVIRLISNMDDGDDAVIHAVEEPEGEL